jgi:hypothetical protein
LNPTVTTRSGAAVIVVLPNWCSMVTGYGAPAEAAGDSGPACPDDEALQR